jgi:hypothetical protein
MIATRKPTDMDFISLIMSLERDVEETREQLTTTFPMGDDAGDNKTNCFACWKKKRDSQMRRPLSVKSKKGIISPIA